MKTLSVVIAVLAVIPALAHHSNSAFDPEKVVRLAIGKATRSW